MQTLCFRLVTLIALCAGLIGAAAPAAPQPVAHITVIAKRLPAPIARITVVGKRQAMPRELLLAQAR